MSFEAYLFWAPKIIPTQHQGVMLRVGNASGTLFDGLFMGYQVSEQNRTRQITAEIFVSQGLDGAINIDRESFNYAHPHYQHLVKWLHSALRQLTNKHKSLGKEIRSLRLANQGHEVRTKVESIVEQSLQKRGVEDVPQVQILDADHAQSAAQLRETGVTVLIKDDVVPVSDVKQTVAEVERRLNAEKKAVAIAQLLQGWNLLSQLSYEDQQELIKDIIRVVMAD